MRTTCSFLHMRHVPPFRRWSLWCHNRNGSVPVSVLFDLFQSDAMQRSNQEDNGGAFYLAQDGHTLLVEDNDSDSDGSSFQQQRCSSLQNPYGCHDLSLSFHDTVLDLYAASKIFYLHLVTFESLLVMLCSIVATTCYYLYGRSSNTGGSSFGANISWMIVSFAIVSPMIMQIKQAFARRELALDVLAESEELVHSCAWLESLTLCLFCSQGTDCERHVGQCDVELGR